MAAAVSEALAVGVWDHVLRAGIRGCTGVD
jgi:hypothetical protein